MKLAFDTRLLASSPTMAGIEGMILKFYCGSPKTLCDHCAAGQPTTVWTVHNKDMTEIQSVIVRLVKGRYRFERRIPREEKAK